MSHWDTVPIIHGHVHGDTDVTLLNAAGTVMDGPSESAKNRYRVEMSLSGCHADDNRFTEAQCHFDWLDAWVQPPPLVDPDGAARTSLTVRFGRDTLAVATVDGAAVGLVTSVEGSAGAEVVQLRRWTAFTVKVPAAVSAQEFVTEWVRPLQDLLVLTLGQSVRLTALFLRHEAADSRDNLAAASFDAVQPSSGMPSLARALSYSAPTLLRYAENQVPFDELMPRWFELRARHSDAIALLLAPYYAPFIFSEHRYASIFQGAEALARASSSDGKEKPADIHDARVNAIIGVARSAGVDRESIEWAERILRNSNHKPLRILIRELLASVGKIGEAVVSAVPNFDRSVARIRNGVSHPVTNSGIDKVSRLWHGELLRWILRARLLLEIGVPLPEIEQRVLNRFAFQDALRRISPGSDVD